MLEALRTAERRAIREGAGKPIPGAGQPDDELWWVKAKLAREKLSFIPPSLPLRKDVKEIDETAAQKRSEAEVRRLVEELNIRIRAANRTGITGPPVTLTPLSPDRVVATWRSRARAQLIIGELACRNHHVADKRGCAGARPNRA